MSKQKLSGFQFDSLNTKAASETPYELALTHPVTGETLPVTIQVYGDDSQAVREYTRKQLKSLMRKQSFAQRTGKNQDPSLDELEEMPIESAIVRTAGWSGFTDNGEELPFTAENARKVYAQLWIAQQVIEASRDLGNFIKG